MKVSFLVPSRDRFSLLHKSLVSLGEHDFEFLVCIDDDEPQADLYEELAKLDKRVRLFVEPRHGYRALHEYCNRLARESKGDWLFSWNDDALMETPNWFEIITGYDHSKPVVLNPYHEVDNLFPVLSRTFYELIGHFSLQTHVDSWVQQIGERSGSQIYVPGIKITHIKPDDETGKISNEVAHRLTGPEFSSEPVQTLINQDAEKVRNWYESHNNM